MLSSCRLMVLKASAGWLDWGWPPGFKPGLSLSPPPHVHSSNKHIKQDPLGPTGAAHVPRQASQCGDAERDFPLGAQLGPGLCKGTEAQ